MPCVEQGSSSLLLGPYNVTLAPGLASAANTTLSGLGNASSWQAGTPLGPFTLQAADQWGNAVDLDCASYQVLFCFCAGFSQIAFKARDAS